MKKIDQLYRTAPVRNSPDALDSKILRQAELQIASRTSAAKPLLMSSWMPMAASCLVVTIGVALVLRSAYMGNGVDAQSDGYPEAIIDSASLIDSKPHGPSLLESDSISTLAQAESAEGVSASGVVAELNSSSDDRQLLQQYETPQYESRSMSKSQTAASVAARSEPGADTVAGRASEDSGSTVSRVERAKPVQQIDRLADIEDAAGLEVPSAEEVVTEAIVAEAIMPARTETERTEATELPGDLRAEQTDNDETALASATQAATHQRVRPPDVKSEAESNPGSIAESNSRQDAIILVNNSAVDWLNGQPQAFYTLQLATAGDDVYLAEFAQGLTSLRPQQFVVLTLPRENDARNYTLLFGSFSSFDSAQRALARLPERARQFGARVRNVGVLQGVLR